MRPSLTILALLLFTAATTPQAKQSTWDGYLVDAMCAKNWKGDGGMYKAKKHMRACAFHEKCKASGFGVFTKGAFVKFTKESDPIALKFLEASVKKDDIHVVVSGELSGGLIDVSRIEDKKK